jgi:hypothetical protein
VEAGSSIDFYLHQDGYGKSYANTWYSQTERNSDGIQHLIAYDYKNYLVLAWEDMTNGGDLDYNDVVFVVDIGEANIENIPTAATPEPHEWAAVILVLMLGWKFQGARKQFLKKLPATPEKAFKVSDSSLKGGFKGM